MYFRMLHDETNGAITYLLADVSAGEAVLVDPQATDVPLLRAMMAERGLRPRWVLRTHEHDARIPRRHRLARDAFDAPLVVHRSPARDILPFGDEHLQVLPTPGHTEGCLSFRWRDRLFCGDLLTADACPYQPRPVLAEALWDSVVNEVFTLPEETLLFGSHACCGRTVSTVYEARRWHPWFGQAGRDEFLERIAGLTEPSVVCGDTPVPRLLSAPRPSDALTGLLSRVAEVEARAS